MQPQPTTATNTTADAAAPAASQAASPAPALAPANTPACRPACAACCTAPSISSPIPGMPAGKPAGMPCVQLDAQGACRIFGQPQRPAVCASLQPSADMCGHSRQHAMLWLARLEVATAPGAPAPQPLG